MRGPWLAALLLVSACGERRHEPGEPPPDAAPPPGTIPTVPPLVVPAGFPAPGQPAVVTLLSPGAAPQRAVRYAPVAGTFERLEMALTVGVALEGADPLTAPGARPAVVLSGLLRVERVGDGVADWGIAIDALRLGAGGEPGARTILLRRLAGLRGLRLRGRTSDRGAVLALDLEGPALRDPRAVRLADALRRAVGQLVVPVPQAPIGVGARWEVRRAISVGGLVLFQADVFEVTADAPDRVQMTVSRRDQAPPQWLSIPVPLPGAPAGLRSLAGAGTGTLTLRAVSPLVWSDLRVTSRVAVEAPLPGSPEPAVITLGSALTVGPPLGPHTAAGSAAPAPRARRASVAISPPEWAHPARGRREAPRSDLSSADRRYRRWSQW